MQLSSPTDSSAVQLDLFDLCTPSLPTIMPAGILQALLGVLRALPYAQRLALWAAAALASGLLLYAGRGSARPGWARLWLALPLLAVNFTIPLLFDGDADLTTNISAFIVTTALSTFKAGMLLGWEGLFVW